MVLTRRCLWTVLLLFLLLPLPALADAAPDVPEAWTAQEAVRYALGNSPDSRAALQAIEASRADISSAQAAFYPQLGISAEYARTDNPMYSFGNILNQGAFDETIDFNNPGETDNLQFKAQVRYRLYNGGRDQSGLEAAEALETAADLDREALHAALGYEVVRAFYTIIQAEETVRANTSALDAIGASIVVARARFDEGDLLKTDLLNLEVQEARARENLIQSSHALELARRGFLNLLGLEQGTVRLDAAGSLPQDAPDQVDEGNRAELLGMDARIASAEAALRQAQGGRLPTADAFGSYQVDNGFELDDGTGNSWLAGIRVDYTLFDGQRTGAAVQRARADLLGLKEQRRKLELAYNLEKEQAVLALAQAEQRVQVTAMMLELARESAQLSRARFKEGVILSSDLIDVENRLNDAEVRHALANAARKIAVADLRRCAGQPQFPAASTQQHP